ncbi:uncharacterized protein LOC120350975 [Nilaparvata lugens]|uniref:uncharacterized protein LOC120350975 n=1 Tax=Nilaparvata lugens TaxID=108931 RepID=UPI00193D850E|nr:uncharacterized protein LOC120350975 [Nilaparvata lugens]
MTAPIINLIILCFVIKGGSALWEEIAGPYDIRLSYASNCDKRGKINLFEPMKVRKLNRTHFVYSGILDTGAPIDDNLKVRIVSSNKGTNGRYNNVIDIEMKACEMARKFGMEIIASIFDHCNQTLQFYCPMERFTCVMKNWTVNYNFNNVPALPYGEYRLEASAIRMHENNRRELISCTRMYGLVTPIIPKPQKKTQHSDRITNASSLITQ